MGKRIVTDMRTSDETAVYQRIQALKQVELSTKITPKISELEKKLVIIQAELVAKQEVEKTDKVRRGLEDIKRKAAKYYNPDETLNRNSTTPENIQKLVEAEAKYKQLDEKFLKHAMQVKKKKRRRKYSVML